MKRIIRPLLMGCLVGLFVTACDKAEPYTQYSISLLKPATGNLPMSFLYANQTNDSLVFYSSEAWEIENMNSGSWVTINGEKSGKGMAIIRYGVTFQPNTTREARAAVFRIIASEHKDKAYTSFSYQQYATRVDGSWGNAALVKKISGSDGSVISLSYDNFSRPLTLSMKTADTERSLTLTWDDLKNTVNIENSDRFVYKDTTFTMNRQLLTGQYGQYTISGVKNSFYDHYFLNSMATTEKAAVNRTVGGDNVRSSMADRKIEYRPFYMNDVYPVSFENALKVLDQFGEFYTQYGIFYNGKGSLQPDGEHLADSMAVYRHFSDGVNRYETYQLTFGKTDNRATSVDVNQLIEGVSQCNPYLLLSMMKFARFTNVVETAKGRFNSYVVKTTQNSNGAVQTMTVSDKSGQTITYTFEY